MDTQNTPVHVKLWHKEFWYMSIAGLLLSSAMYILVPVMPQWLTDNCGLSTEAAAIIMGLHGIGVFLLGSLTSYLVQRYRRGRIYLKAVFVLMLSFVAIYYLKRGIGSVGMFTTLCALRLLQGAFYGEARIVLGSTLIIDTCESDQRTMANHSAGWFTRFGLAIGPAVALVVMPLGGIDMVLAVAACMCATAYLLIAIVKFPFKAPDDTRLRLSLDRFWLTEGWYTVLNLLPIAAVAGMVLVSGRSLSFYSMMMCGFFLSLLAQRFLFSSAEPKSEVVSGLLLVLASLAIMTGEHTGTPSAFAAVLFGCGIGLVCARLLLNLIMQSDHCKRGTAQSTFFLACEFGVSLGITCGYSLFYGRPQQLFTTALCLTAAALALYLIFTHKWFMGHKHR